MAYTPRNSPGGRQRRTGTCRETGFGRVRGAELEADDCAGRRRGGPAQPGAAAATGTAAAERSQEGRQTASEVGAHVVVDEERAGCEG